VNSTNGKALIEVRGLHKSFPGVLALNDVSFQIKRNTIHCIVGENGAGKSTFIKILSGAMTKTQGEVLLAGRPFEPRTVREAMASGISVLYQELNVVEDLTVAENLTLGQEKHRFGFIRRGEDLGRVEEILRGLDDSIRLNMLVGDLSVAQRQVIEIAKVVSMDSSVLIMDEPTAALSEEEVRRLFLIVEKLKQDGLTIIYISHKLAEVFEIGDYVTVFRDGQMVGTAQVSAINAVELVRMMLGKVVVESYIPSRSDTSTKLLEVRGLTNKKLKGVSFELYKGEILGFYGLVGAGKTEVARALYGLDEYQGEIRVKGGERRFTSVRGALASGFSMVPEERRGEGIFGKLSIRANIPMMRMASILAGGLISRAKEAKLADVYIQKMSVVARDREQKVATLSGGNQQKVVISKCLNREGEILLMDEPTRGVDVGAKHEIHDIIRGLANEGKGIIVFSSELPEILHLCDRIVLLNEGRVCEVLQNGVNVDSDRIMALVAGGKA
jgi:ABC-type sugar transport system ATPase subunit